MRFLNLRQTTSDSPHIFRPVSGRRPPRRCSEHRRALHGQRFEKGGHPWHKRETVPHWPYKQGLSWERRGCCSSPCGMRPDRSRRQMSLTSHYLCTHLSNLPPRGFCSESLTTLTEPVSQHFKSEYLNTFSEGPKIL